MKAVVVSINPKWCEKIASGEKTIEVRKTRPKIDTPFKCYIYCTQAKTIGDIILCKSEENTKLFGYNTVKGINRGFAKNEDIKLKGKVIGEFVCDSMYGISNFLPYDTDDIHHDFLPYVLEQTCLQDYEIDEYLGAKDGYGWHISDLVIYDKPKSLEMFSTGKIARDCGCGGYMIYDKILTRPPMSWCYVEDEEKENEQRRND